MNEEKEKAEKLKAEQEKSKTAATPKAGETATDTPAPANITAPEKKPVTAVAAGIAEGDPVPVKEKAAEKRPGEKDKPAAKEKPAAK